MKKYEIQSKVFKFAHFCKRFYKLNTFSEALIIAWKSIKLKKYLKEGAVYIKYFTQNQFPIETFGTLRNIEDRLKGSNQFQNDKIHIRYFDLPKQDFRTIEVKNLISIIN